MKVVGHAQVWWADLDNIRPVVVLTRATVAPLLRRVLVAPVTSTVRDIGSEVAIGVDEGVTEGSVMNLDNIQLVPVDVLLQRAGTIGAERWPEVCRAVAHVIAC